MKLSSQKTQRVGLTLMEVLLVVAILAILAILFLRTLARPDERHLRFICVNNLKQINLSFRIYAGGNNDKYPMNVSTNGKPLIIETTPVHHYFQLLSNELGTPKVLICPEDKKRKTAKDFTNLNNVNISYFVGLDGHESFPNSILSGDRNITNGFAPKENLLNLTSNQMVGFTKEIHQLQGNIALGDGSVQQVSSARLRSEIIRNSPFATNRIKLP